MQAGSPKPSHVFREVAANRPIRLDNVRCVYCNKELSADTITEEHVIGRRFVPKGKLENRWNLIVNACQPCNTRKSDLEDDISAITLQPDPSGRHAHNDANAVSDGRRKANRSISRRTKKTVAHSQETLSITMPIAPGASFTFTFTTSPQLDQRRAFELAWMQLVAFFYWITFDAETKRGGYWLDTFFPIMFVNRADWGNQVMKAFADSVADWEPRVCGLTADGFFKVLIKRHPNAACWSWALEWNQMTRLVGFFGDKEATRAIVGTFPKLKKELVAAKGNDTIHYREEIQLDEVDDRLFYYDDKWQPSMGEQATP